MALSKLQASIAEFTNEITVAAANIKFDFTLVKYEAPQEYQPLGRNLSPQRRKDAEIGGIHVIAQRLGALFEGLCPSTPSLVSKYGTRVSEISEASTNQETTQFAASVFAAHAGIDGSSIWAAATSSPAAIQVHLLACLLARAWGPQEATSIWAEIIAERRDEIAKNLDGPGGLPYSVYAAGAQATISRGQLAEWDASARAWLQYADRIKTRQQTQLMLILNNLTLQVHTDVRTYSSVINAWKLALEALENIVTGQPLAISVQAGAALLGVSAWHLFPDLVVMVGKGEDIRMDDPLIPAGGIITVGLQPAEQLGHLKEHRGLYWSLSLAHLRFYGHPVPRESEIRLDAGSSRVTFNNFTKAVFGLGEEVTWLKLFSQIASDYLNGKDKDQRTTQRLLNLGQRRWEQFFGCSRFVRDPFFCIERLEDSKTIISQIDDVEKRVLALDI
ncbi:hypothetical protein F5Y19DRAFT_461449 [Xylariaceae sp. FL1651]|nr:hypothetical protein F5Y19DRAFT_461449 [Xylariaceae sp. FL1651]